MVLDERSVFRKLDQLDRDIELALQGELESPPERPGRDIECLPIQQLPGRMGLSSLEGQQKLLHDLANIELQAMELGMRTLIEFPSASPSFRQQLIGVIRDEAKHLKLCLQALDSLGGRWGQWPVHLGLWNATDPKDSLLERVFIVHRYLEASGLDAGESLLRRLSGVNNKVVGQVVKVIVDEEVGHVEFGSRWFRQFSEEQQVDSHLFYERLTRRLLLDHPRKEKLSLKLRAKALYTPAELKQLNQLQKDLLF